ncbi:hypothetical protein D3C81_1903700 [compost metagenome]
MLTGTCFSDDLGFTHTFCQQRLTQHLVSLVRTAVQQVFTLQIQGGASTRGDVLAFGQRGRAACIVFQQVGKLRLKLRIFLRADEGFFQLAQGRHQNLWHIHAAKFTKIGVE